jgi:serine phosphatase RsbU (regulator of sigma subunit)
MRVDVASRTIHHRKYGATFAESWTSADGATLLAVGSVLAGGDPVVVSDLMRTGARALVTSRKALAGALGALDRIVQNHAREHRDDELAAALYLLAGAPGSDQLDLAGAGQLHAAIIDDTGKQRPLHGRAGPLGTGIEPRELIESVRLRRDDLLVVATVVIEPAWWQAGDRGAEALLRLSDAPEASAGVVRPG